jgi:quercetin dioxygenase-like cupin family protein
MRSFTTLPRRLFESATDDFNRGQTPLLQAATCRDLSTAGLKGVSNTVQKPPIVVTEANRSALRTSSGIAREREGAHTRKVRYIRIYNSRDGSARFEDGEVPFASAVFAPPAPPLDVSPAVAVREMMFIHLPAGWTDPAHPAPARQWMFVLSGRGETKAGGETRVWGPGDTLLAEDTAPPGHTTTVVEDAVLAVVRV